MIRRRITPKTGPCRGSINPWSKGRMSCSNNIYICIHHINIISVTFIVHRFRVDSLCLRMFACEDPSLFDVRSDMQCHLSLAISNKEIKGRAINQFFCFRSPFWLLTSPCCFVKPDLIEVSNTCFLFVRLVNVMLWTFWSDLDKRPDLWGYQWPASSVLMAGKIPMMEV